MRTVTPSTQAKLDQKLGTEVMLLVEVDWVSDTTILYSDQTLDGAEAKIVAVGGFDTSMRLEGSGDSQEVSVVLDDTDASLRALYNSVDMHKRPARIYLLHKGLDISNKLLLFQGEVVTPFEWDESQRTLSFNILSKLNSTEVGFSMEEGDFANIPEEALGKAWPLVFGQVCNMPIVMVRAPRRGYLLEGEGIVDFTLEPRLCQAMKLQCPPESQGAKQVTSAWEQEVNGKLGVITVYGADRECSRRALGEVCKLRDLRDQQEAYEHDTLNIYNGDAFPQGEEVVLNIDQAEFSGSFSGNTFTITNRVHPEYADFDHLPCRSVSAAGYSSSSVSKKCGNIGCYFIDSDTGKQPSLRDILAWEQENRDFEEWARTLPVAMVSNKGDEGPWQIAGSDEEFDVFCADAWSQDESNTGATGGENDSWRLYDMMGDAGFYWTPAGSEVYMETESEILYTVSLLPGTVDRVSAYRTAPNGFRYLTEVPESYYTVHETDYTGYQVVELELHKPLALYDDTWGSELYVSFTSSVGPNTCDIIEWLVGKYTDLTVDATTFAAVKTYLANYPQNFYLTARADVYQLIQDIAYQARCSVYIRNDVMYITYLSLEPTSVRTLSEDDILSGTFKESLSDTNEVYTTHKIKWQKGGVPVRDDQQAERNIILKYNVDKYGTVEQEWDYFTYNIYELALKTSTFWLVRKSSSWKRVQFDVPLKNLDLDVGDSVTLDVAQFSSTPVKCVIENTSYDPDKNTVSLICWTPVRSGESEQFYWAWPSQQSAYGVWPMPGDTHGGAGYDFQVIPPIDHILRGGEKRYDQIIITTGDLHPSDLDDTFPTVICEVSEYLDFDQKEPVIEAKELAQSAGRQQNNQAVSDNGGSGSKRKKKKKSGAGCGSSDGCNYKVYVQWLTTKTQGSGRNSPSGCGGPCGENVTGCPSCSPRYLWKVCHSYKSATIAFAAYRCWKAQIKSISGTWYPNETGIIGVTATFGDYKKPPLLNDDDAAKAEDACKDDWDSAKSGSGGGGAGGGGGSSDDGSFVNDESAAPVSDNADLPGSPTGYDNSDVNPYLSGDEPIAGSETNPYVDDAGNVTRDEDDPTANPYYNQLPASDDLPTVTNPYYADDKYSGPGTTNPYYSIGGVDES